MRKEQKNAIQLYFQTIDLLKVEHVIRSDTVLGDLGEFLACSQYPELKMVKQKNKPGYDAKLNGELVQIKFSDSADTENIKLGDPEKYNQVIVVLGKNSKHRKEGSPDDDFLFYRYTSQEVKDNFKITGAYTLAYKKHFKEHEYSLNLFSDKST